MADDPKKTFWQTIWWWLQNDHEQQLSEAPWYMPEWPQWRRELYWYYFRNPLQNFRAYTIGVVGQEFETVVVYGNPDPHVIQRNDVGETGWQVTYLQMKDGRILPFVSYSGRVVFQLGWQPGRGFFGLKLNLHTPPKT